VKKAFITGASGFIGHALCSQLFEQGWHLRVLLRQPMTGPWHETVISDLETPLPRDLLDGIDVVFHLAGKAHALSENQQDVREYFRINTEGTRKLLEAARDAGVPRFVLFSSVKAMNEGSHQCLDEMTACLPETPYGKSKLEAERLVLNGEYVSEPAVLRLSMVYGPAMKGNLPRMIEAVAKGVFPPIPEFGNKRSMVHVKDVVQASLLAAEKPEAVGQTYIVTDGQPYSTREMYEWICETLDKPVPGWHLPEMVFRGLARFGDMIGKLRGQRFFFDSDALDKVSSSSWYSSQKIKTELGYHPNHHLRDTFSDILKSCAQ
jgi:nucleoside-diphosphate-sugar epimerase